MAERSYPLDDTEYDQSDVMIWFATRTRGVFSGEHLTPSVISGMTISMSSGIAWLKPDPKKFLNAVYASDEPVQFTVATADGMFKRIDSIVLRWDFTAVPNTIKQHYKKGIPGSTPVSPEVQNDANAHEMKLIDIEVPAGAMQITAANIKDRRLDESVCGIMRDGVTGIPTQSLYNSWQAFFLDVRQRTQQEESDLNEFFDNIKDDATNWLTSYKQEAERIYTDWYNPTTQNFESLFSAWFTELQNTLDENQASNLFNKIDSHEKLTKLSQPSGAHGDRLKGDKLQVYISSLGGWATYAMLSLGYTWEYRDSLDYTWLQWDSFDYTAEQYDNLIEVEV